MSALREIPVFSSPIIKNLRVSSFIFFSITLADAQNDKRSFYFGTEMFVESSEAADPYQEYSPHSGYGFDMNTVRNVQVEEHAFIADSPVYFSVHIPEGNYRKEVIFGSNQKDSETTMKAESRGLILQEVQVKKGEQLTKSIAVDVRRPQIHDEESKPDLELQDHLKASYYNASTPKSSDSRDLPESSRYESTKPEGN